MIETKYAIGFCLGTLLLGGIVGYYLNFCECPEQIICPEEIECEECICEECQECPRFDCPEVVCPECVCITKITDRAEERKEELERESEEIEVDNCQTILCPEEYDYCRVKIIYNKDGASRWFFPKGGETISKAYAIDCEINGVNI